MNDDVQRLLAYVRPQNFADLVDRTKNVYLILKETEECKFGDHKKGRGFDALNNHRKGEFSKPQFCISPLVMGSHIKRVDLLAPERSSRNGVVVHQTFTVDTQTKVCRGGIISKLRHYMATVKDPT